MSESPGMSSRLRVWMPRCTYLSGGAAIVLGLTVLYGWFSGNTRLTQVLADLVAMQTNTALGFVLCGAALVALARRARGTAAVLAGLAGAVGLATLAEYASGADLGIDEWLIVDYIRVLTSHPGRMAPNTALSFSLAAAALLGMSARAPGRRAPVWTGMAALVVLALGVVSLIGYASGLEGTYGWGNLTRMAVHTAAGFVVIGAGIFAHGLCACVERGRLPAVWLSAPAGMAGVVLSVVLWQAHAAEERTFVLRDIEHATDGFRQGLDARVDHHLGTLTDLRERARAWASRRKLKVEAEHIVAEDEDLRAIAQVDAEGELHWLGGGPTGGAERGPDYAAFPGWQAALARARESGQPIVWRPPPGSAVVGHSPAILIILSTGRGRSVPRYIAGVFDARGLFRSSLAHLVGHYAVSVSDARGEITRFGDAPPVPEWTREEKLVVPGALWHVRLWPTPQRLRALRSVGLVGALLVAGLLGALSVAFSLHLLVLSRRRAHGLQRAKVEVETARAALEDINESLERTVAERTAAAESNANARQRSEARFRKLIELAPEAILLVGAEGRILTANERAHVLFGYAPAELYGESVDRLVPARLRARHAAHRKCFTADPAPRMTPLFRDGLVGLRKDGSEFPVEINLGPIESDAGPLVAAIARDVTARVAMERELKRSNAALEEFAYVASHDMREPLRKIRQFGERLKDRCAGSLDEHGALYLHYMVDGATRMQALIEGLLDIAGIGSAERAFEPVDLGAVVHEVTSDMSRALEESGGHVEAGHLPVIAGDPVQIRQLMQNLIGNAVKFHRDGEAPRIGIECEPDPTTVVVSSPGAASSDGMWRISVSDNGIGFDDKDAERTFTPFGRLNARAAFPGAGMGLAICRKIAARHGAELSVSSTPGEGSRFTFSVPRSRAAGEPDDA